MAADGFNPLGSGPDPEIRLRQEVCPTCRAVGFGNATCSTCVRTWKQRGHIDASVCDQLLAAIGDKPPEPPFGAGGEGLLVTIAKVTLPQDPTERARATARGARIAAALREPPTVPRRDVRVLSTRPCSVAHCNGGHVEVHRNARGEVDYLDGQPTGEIVPCDYCGGTGEEPDEVEA